MHSALRHEPSEQLSVAHGFYRGEIFAEQIASFFKLSCQRAGIAERPKLPCASQAQRKRIVGFRAVLVNSVIMRCGNEKLCEFVRERPRPGWAAAAVAAIISVRVKRRLLQSAGRPAMDPRTD